MIASGNTRTKPIIDEYLDRYHHHRSWKRNRAQSRKQYNIPRKSIPGCNKSKELLNRAYKCIAFNVFGVLL